MGFINKKIVENIALMAELAAARSVLSAFQLSMIKIGLLDEEARILINGLEERILTRKDKLMDEIVKFSLGEK